MKTRYVVLLVLACLALAPAATPQYLPQMTQITVPFEFYVNDTLLPSGTYTITADAGKEMISLTNRDTGQTVSTFENDIETPTAFEKPKLVFVNDNGRHILHQVALGGDSHIHDLLHEPGVKEP